MAATGVGPCLRLGTVALQSTGLKYVNLGQGLRGVTITVYPALPQNKVHHPGGLAE